MKRNLMSLFVLCATLVGGAHAQPLPAREQIERRLASVATLIETSSGARQVEAAQSPASVAQREAARAAHRAAAAAFAAGDLAQANAQLDAAARAMFEAVRLAAPERVAADKAQRDFAARLESIQALLAAHQRIAKEKKTPGAAEVTRQVNALLAQANALAGRGDHAAARAPLDQAYLTVKAAVSAERSGDTLVRSLTFANAEEEYRYEVDRNDTHRMLVDLLLKEKRANAAVEAQVARFLDSAAAWRREAEGAAARGDFERGIRALEESTRELVRAIRGAGVYIPG